MTAKEMAEKLWPNLATGIDDKSYDLALIESALKEYGNARISEALKVVDDRVGDFDYADAHERINALKEK